MPCGSSGVPPGPTTTAAAAWSWVEKMLQLHQRTSAPSAVSVSISTAVWIVICSEPVIRAPFSGWASAYSPRIDIRPGISCSASVISLRPNSARDRSATLKSVSVSVAVGVIVEASMVVSGASAVFEGGLQPVEILPRSRRPAWQRSEVARDEIAQQDELDHARDRCLATGLQPEARHRVV